MKKNLILITNDDGIESPGLKAAVEAVLELGEIIVVAPSKQQTAMSRALCGAKDEYFRKIDFIVEASQVKAYHINASPAMTIQHAYNVLFNRVKPDLIISGINYGENLGWDTMLSGTVGAAFQGAAHGTPAIAVSQQTSIENHFNYGRLDWEGAKYFVKLFARQILKEGMPERAKVLKIDVPAGATEKTEWKYTKLAGSHHFFTEIENPHAESKLGEAKVKIYNSGTGISEDTDIHAIMVDKVTAVVPLGMDLTVNLKPL